MGKDKILIVGGVVAMLFLAISLGKAPNNEINTIDKSSNNSSVSKSEGGSVTQNLNINSEIPKEKEKVNINTATLYELDDKLTSVGPKKAQLIIDNRPYKSIYELKEKGILGIRAFNSNKELVRCD